jgi:hypothetical protein
MRNDLSPEERLLRIIKERQKRPPAKEEPAPMTDIEIKEEKESPLKERIMPKEEKPKKQTIKRKFAFNVTYLYMIGAIVISALVFMAIINIFSNNESKELSDLKTMVTSVSKDIQMEPVKEGAKTAEQTKPQQKLETKPAASFDEYEKLLKEKNIFTPSQPEREKGSLPASKQLRELTKDLRLVGILPGDEPQVIIEDKKSGQTLFLKEGELIDAIEVRKISTGKVVLGYGDETITLSM